MVSDPKGNVVLDSPETVAALEYSKQLYDTFLPGTLSWQDPSNNKVFFDGQIGLTNNGISVYYAAKLSKDPTIHAQIGRAPGRERVVQSVEISVVAGHKKKK